jgi:hypothetical protein
MENILIEKLDMIIADCEQDVKDFEGREFTGRTLGQLHGILEAKIQALAKIMKAYITKGGENEDHALGGSADGSGRDNL